MRMRIAVLKTVVSTAMVASTAGGQANPCASAPIEVQDGCLVTVDLFRYVTPQLGIALTGGNVILAQGGSNGGIPRFTVGARATGLIGNLPTLQTPSATGPAPRDSTNPYPTADQKIALPGADASIGVFRGFDAGYTSVLGIDALVSAAYVPTVTTSGIGGPISIEPDNPIAIGFGARLGLVEETVLVPGVGLNVMLRRLPTTTIIASTGNDSLRVSDYALKTLSWRVTTAKSFAPFTIAAGIGQDIYDASTTFESIVNRPVIGRVTTGALTTSSKVTRTNYFANFSLNLIVAKLVAEGGMVSGGDLATSNVFDIGANEARTYVSAGFRIGY